MIFGVFLVLFLVGDNSVSSLSLNLGASGLALKILICSAIFHSLGYVVFFKELGFVAFLNLIRIYFQLIFLMILMFFTKFYVSNFFENINSYIFFLTYNLIYLFLVLILVRYFPNIFGLQKISFYKNFLK